MFYFYIYLCFGIEHWKDIPGFKDYQVSSWGRFKKIYKSGDKILTHGLTHKGYMRMYFYSHGERKSFLAHRIIGSIFVENPENKPQINHINGIKTCNYWWNVEWCTAKENVSHVMNQLGKHNTKGKFGKDHFRSKIVGKFSTDGILLDTYFGQNEASRKSGIAQSSISLCCRGIQKIAGGYCWKFIL